MLPVSPTSPTTPPPGNHHHVQQSSLIRLLIFSVRVQIGRHSNGRGARFFSIPVPTHPNGKLQFACSSISHIRTSNGQLRLVPTFPAHLRRLYLHSSRLWHKEVAHRPSVLLTCA